MKKEKNQINSVAKVLVAVALMVIPLLMNAQTDTVKVKDLTPVVISATRSPQNPDSIGRSISVITAEQLKDGVYSSLSDVLSKQENIFIPGSALNPGMSQSIFMRGTNSNQTVIMVDGVRLSDPSSTNNAADLSEVSLLDVERIEIVRGAQSTMFGSSAIGGVINIITKESEKNGMSGSASVTAGNFGKETYSLAEDVFVNYKLNNGFYANAEVIGENINGLDATVDTVTDPNAFKNRDNDDLSKIEFNTRIGYNGKKLKASLAYRNLDKNTDLDKSAYTDDNNYTLSFERQLLSFAADYKVRPKLNIALNGGFTATDRYAQDDSSIVDTAGTYDHTFYDDRYQGTFLCGDLQGNYRSDNFEVVGGSGLTDETMTAANYYYSNTWGVYESRNDLDTLNIDVLTTYAYLYTRLKGGMFSKKLRSFSLGLGGRYSNHERFEGNYSWEINPSLHLTKDAMLFGTYSAGFNAPSLYQLFSPSKDAVSGIMRGNRYLKPETSVSAEAGLKIFPVSECVITASYFYSRVKNSIEYVYLWNKSTAIDSLTFFDYLGDTYLNLGTQTTHGIELGINAKLNKKLSFSLNMAILGGSLEYSPSSIDSLKTKGNHVQLYNNGAFLEGKDIKIIGFTRRPSTANISLQYQPSAKLGFSTNVSYTGAYNDVYYNSELGPFGALGNVALQDYTLLGFTARYKVTTSMNLFLRLDNIFDTKYSQINGFSTRGRGIYVCMKFTF